MSQLYQSLIKEIKSALKEYGRGITIRKLSKSGSLYNPDITFQDFPSIGVSDNYDLSLIDGSVIKKGDIQYFIDCEIEVDQSSKIIDDGETYSIVSFQLIKPGDTELLYIIQARK